MSTATPLLIFAVRPVASESCEIVLHSRTRVTLLQLLAVLSQDRAIGLWVVEEAIVVEAEVALTWEERTSAGELDQDDGSSLVVR